MAFGKWLVISSVLCLTLFSAFVAPIQEGCLALAISLNCPQPGESCVTLQEGLQEVASWDPVSPPHDCVDLNLSPGEHVLSSPVAINGTAIRFRLHGSGKLSTSIQCARDFLYSVNHTVHFDGLELILIEGVHMFGCDRPVRLSRSKNVSILHSSFSLFTTGALDIYNCFQVQIEDSTFMNNAATAQIRDEPYRGNAGAIAIGIHRSPFADPNPNIAIRNCTFTGNRAKPSGTEDVVSTSQFVEVSNRLLTGRGGGVRVYIGESLSVTAIVEDCFFERNYALNFGGGLYITLRQDANHAVTVRGSRFLSNEAGGGGGLLIGYNVSSDAVPSVLITDCTFIGNYATFGGGAYMYPLNNFRFGALTTFRRCIFEQNSAESFGTALGLLSPDVFVSQNEFVGPYFIDNCTFRSNTGRKAASLDIIYYPVVMLGYNVFRNNSGPSLRIVGAEVILNGTVDFIGNNAENLDGGALYIISHGQVVLQRGSQMNFIENRGSLGSAIVVETQHIRTNLLTTVNNPLCFFRYDDSSLLGLPPSEWKEVSISFSSNAALIGPTAYLTQLDLCSWDRAPNSSFSFDRNRVLQWPFVYYTDDNLSRGHPGDQAKNPSFYIQTAPINLNVSSPRVISESPGRPIAILSNAIDELGNPTWSAIRFNDVIQNSGAVKRYSFQPKLLIFTPLPENKVIEFGVNVEDYTVTSEVVLTTYKATSLLRETISQHVPFTAQACPIGYQLVTVEGRQSKTCICNTANNPDLVHCEPDGETYILLPNIWTLLLENSDGSITPKGYRCPTDYCGIIHNTTIGESTYGTVFNSSEVDLQCSCNRSGILCGRCPNNFGYSTLRNRCVTCSSAYVSLIVVLIFADILICVGIMAAAMPLPMWVYPCLFYIQTLPYITENFPVTFNAVQKYLYYISSLLALYFPYDFCLHGSISALLIYLLRYVPLLVIIPTLVVMVCIVYHKKIRLTEWYGVWVLVLLTYTQVVHTSMSILNCSPVAGHGLRWYINGDIECFKGGHLPLALLAITVLLLALLLIPLCALITFEKLPAKARCFHHLLSPLTKSFKAEVHWWGAIELSRRFLLLLFTIPFPGNNFPPAVILIISTTVYLFIQPYRSQTANIVEAILSTSTLILLLGGSDAAITEGLLFISSKQLEGFVTSNEKCPDPVRGVTRLTILLAPFYYLPLFTAMCGIVIAVAYYFWSTRKIHRNCYRKRSEREDNTPRRDTYTLFEVTGEETLRSENFKSTLLTLDD